MSKSKYLGSGSDKTKEKMKNDTMADEQQNTEEVYKAIGYNEKH